MWKFSFAVASAFAGLFIGETVWAASPGTLVETKTVHALPNLTLTPASTSNLGTFDIVISPGSGLSSNPAALAAFNRAAAVWESRISDPITVTINADMAVLGSGIIGSTNSVALSGGYDVVRNAVVADGSAAPNGAILSSLPTAAQFTATLPAGRSLNGNIVLNKANAKALGFAGLDTTFGVSDASMTFSSVFAFDYDRSDGIASGTMDFESVAAHEIGHALGFISSVDDIDQTTSTTLPTVSVTTLDLFRFGLSSNNPATTSQFTTFPRNLVPGSAAITDDLSNEYQMSTGLANGDGRQASHWKADELTGNYIGIMDPTLSFGQTTLATDADFRAFDLIGYDVVVPEPSLLATAGLAALALGRRGRKQ